MLNQGLSHIITFSETNFIFSKETQWLQTALLGNTLFVMISLSCDSIYFDKGNQAVCVALQISILQISPSNQALQIRKEVQKNAGSP